MDDIKQLLSSLHPLERKALPHLKEGISLQELEKASGLKEIEAMRALQWMENKGILKISQELKEIINLDKNGMHYREKGLPERRFLEQIKDKKEAKVSDIVIPKDELNIAIGALRKKAAIGLRKDQNGSLMVSITEQGKALIQKESFEEIFLKKLPMEVSKLTPEEKFAYDSLIKRKEIIKADVVKLRTVNMTDIGLRLSKEKNKLKLHRYNNS